MPGDVVVEIYGPVGLLATHARSHLDHVAMTTCRIIEIFEKVIVKDVRSGGRVARAIDAEVSDVADDAEFHVRTCRHSAHCPGKCESRSAGIRTVENGVIRLNEARTPSTVAVDQMRAIGSTTSHDCEPMKVVVRKINRRGEHVDYPACSGCRGAVTREFKVIHLHVTRPDEPGVAVIVIGA